ncbi:MAG: PAS domain-containing sensor histidine kinase [Planctomycetes bacterium]|nr:PAS domain-containing sensor histidine kinase [Planctomycetota bacterium]
MKRVLELALRERVKELTCLYQVAKIAARADESVASMLRDVVQLLPPALLHADVAAATIVLDGVRFHAGVEEIEGPDLSVILEVSGINRGQVAIGYGHLDLEPGKDVFLPEEEHLLEAVAREIGQLVARREAEDARARLQQQLHHADRLATIGSMAASVAHEINEPLGAILGFTQLAQKVEGLSESVQADLQKVVAASLQAREIVRRLLVFARQQPSSAQRVDMNGVVEEVLRLFERRAAAQDLEVDLHLGPGLPAILIDPIQLNQVIVNLVVNAFQAMRKGGTLTVATETREDVVILRIIDTGVGMERKVRERIFLPFFTAQDGEQQGTGLGLAIVHGIITAHRGTIRVDSKPGFGSTFEVRLPVAAAEPGEEAL